MKQIVNKFKPKSGKYHFLHTLLVIILPILLYVLIRIGFVELAIIIVLVSKWRLFAVRPRHWPANVRSNAVDILLGISIVVFMSQTLDYRWQLFWAVLYALWLLFVKPKSSVVWVGLQALIAQTATLMAIYEIWANRSTLWLTISVGIVCYLTARHFLSAFDDAMSRTIAYSWAYVCASIAWLTGHWLVFYPDPERFGLFQVVSQPTLLITVVGYGVATLYYLYHSDRLSKNVRRQVVIVLCATAFIVIMFSGNVSRVL